MDHLELVAEWGARQLAMADNEREQAAVALAIAALQPFVPQDRRVAWMTDAAMWGPDLGPSLAHIAWRVPSTSIRRAFGEAWPQIKATEPVAMDEPGGSDVSEIPLHAPPVLTAIAHGNRKAVADAIAWEGEPNLIALPEGAEHNHALINHTRVGRPTQAAPWLAWALWFQQWDLAGDLFKLPSQQTQENLDRSLFELMQRFSCAKPIDGGAYPLDRDQTGRRFGHGFDAQEACQWVERLVEAGADPHYQPRGMVEYNRREWFVGRIDGLDRVRLEAGGWEIKQGISRRVHADTAMRELDEGAQIELPSAATLAFAHDGPVVWRKIRGAMDSLDEEEALALEAMGNIYEQDFTKIGCMWTNATPEQWVKGIQALVFGHADALFEKSGSKPLAWCPSFMLEGFAKARIEDLSQPIGDTPHCPWLDCIALHLRADGQGLKEVASFHGTAVQTMAGRLHGNKEAFLRGLQRACAIATRQSKTKFAKDQPHASVDEFLAIPGIDAMLQSMDEGFRDSFEVFCGADRYMHASWHKLANPDGQSLGSQESEAIEQASDALRLHRAMLPSLIRNPEPAKQAPRM